MSDLLDMAKKALALAKQKGADEATASAYRSREVEIGWRDGKVEKVTEATSRGVSLSVYVGHRYSSVSTSDLREDALAKFVEESIALCKTLTADANRSLPDPKLYAGRFSGDLQIRDSSYSAVSAQQRRELAKELEDSARAAPGADKILSVTASVSDSETTSARVTTNGFEGEISRTSYWLSADVSVKDPDGRRPEDYDYAGARFFSELPRASLVGKNATARALTAIGAKKAASAEMTMIVENRVAGRLLGAILGPLGARALQQKQSFLEGKLKQPIASSLLTVVDDPHVEKGFGSRLWDGDGIASKKMSVIDHGVLKWLPPPTEPSCGSTFSRARVIDFRSAVSGIGMNWRSHTSAETPIAFAPWRRIFSTSRSWNFFILGGRFDPTPIATRRSTSFTQRSRASHDATFSASRSGACR
ncbi:MAG TPA: TldD/PmbA family protein [Polyangiaceae bacterium]|jgi:PmbA protein|nr:TldD/PmbA family protein [Polyangiaceae bacterium]